MKKLMLVMVAIMLAGATFAEVKRFDVPVGDSPGFGPQDAVVTIIEFIDYQ